MGSSREIMHQKVKAYLEHFRDCEMHSYEHPEYKKHFQMADALTDYIVKEYQSGNLDGKDLFDSKIELEDLFNMHKDEQARRKAIEVYKLMQKDIKEYLADEDS